MAVNSVVDQALSFHARSDIGMVRDENQDSYCIHVPESKAVARAKGILLVMADGMGGLAYGATASKLAVEALREVYYGTSGDAARVLQDGAEEANRRIHQQTQQLPGNQPMGSTLTALAVFEGGAVLAHVGDSRAYRYSRSGGLKQLTRDHTLVQELAERGEIEPDSLPYLLHRNVLTRGLGLQEEVEVDILELAESKEVETFLLCSDGLYDVVTDSEIESRLIAHDLSLTDLVDDLIALARNRGAPDNVTVLVARIDAGAARNEARVLLGAPEATGPEPKVLGFLPRSVFVPLSYFLTFALGVLLTIDFETGTPMLDGRVERPLRKVLADPRLREYAEGEGKSELVTELEAFLEWVGEQEQPSR